MLSDDVQKKILECLSNSSEDLTILQIAECVGINRNTAAKRLLLLEAYKKVKCRSVSRAKLYRLASMPSLNARNEAQEQQAESLAIRRPRLCLVLLRMLFVEKYGDEVLDELDITESVGILKIKPKTQKLKRIKHSELRDLAMRQLGGRFISEDNSFEI